MKKMARCSVLTLFLVVVIFSTIANGQGRLDQAQNDRVQKIIVRVDGLSCPFCAFGLEKRLKNLAGVEEVRLFIKRGMAELRLKEGEAIAEETVREAVLGAGFTPREIQIVRGSE